MEQLNFVVTLSPRDNQKLSKLLSKWFERLVYWNEYQTKRADKNTTKKIRFYLESHFTKVNRLFVLVYLKRNADLKQLKTWGYYLPQDTSKSYNVIINRKTFMINLSIPI